MPKSACLLVLKKCVKQRLSQNKLRNNYNLIIVSHFNQILLFLGGAHLWHVEVLRLGVECVLQLLAYAATIATLDLSRI